MNISFRALVIFIYSVLYIASTILIWMLVDPVLVILPAIAYWPVITVYIAGYLFENWDRNPQITIGPKFKKYRAKVVKE